MGELVPKSSLTSDLSEQRALVQPVELEAPSKSQRRMLTLPPFAPLTYTTQFSGMSGSPSSARRRAALTPSQTLQHASGSFFPPELHVHEDWVFRTTDTIPEASYSGSSSGSASNLSPDLAAVATPASIRPTVHESQPSLAPAYSIPPTHPRPRAYSYNASSSGMHYSSAHRRVPSSPSFRSPSLPYDHAYFDRPPSPTFSISSRSSEPSMGGSLSLSELLAGTQRMSLGEYGPIDESERARREEMREERRQAMLERHAAVIEHREKKRWAKTTRSECIEWVESHGGKIREW